MGLTEESLLGCMIVDNSIIGEVLTNLEGNDFSSSDTRKMFECIKSLYNDSKKIDIISLSEIFKDYTLINKCHQIAIPSQYKEYVKKVKENSVKRKINYTAKEIQRNVANGGIIDIEQFRTECINKFNFDTDIKSSIDDPVSNYLEQFIKQVHENKKRKIVKTGFDSLDKKLGGGLFPGFYLLGAISSLGKTAITIQMADNIAKSGTPVIFFSLEMPKSELVSRSISRIMFNNSRDYCKNVSTRTILNGWFADYVEEMDEALCQYEDTSKNLIIHECAFNTHVEDIRSKVKAYVTKTGKKPVVFVDYLQIVKAQGNLDKQVVDNVVVGLKTLTRDFDIPLIAISAFNRASYATKVSFENFKESGSLEYTADVLLGLQLSILNNLDQEKNKLKVKDEINRIKESDIRDVTLVCLKQSNGCGYFTQDFVFYCKNNHLQEV